MLELVFKSDYLCSKHLLFGGYLNKKNNIHKTINGKIKPPNLGVVSAFLFQVRLVSEILNFHFVCLGFLSSEFQQLWWSLHILGYLLIGLRESNLSSSWWAVERSSGQ